MTIEERCETCRYWRYTPDADAKGCTRFPPVFAVFRGEDGKPMAKTEFSKPGADWVCGEYWSRHELIDAEVAEAARAQGLPAENLPPAVTQQSTQEIITELTANMNKLFGQMEGIRRELVSLRSSA